MRNISQSPLATSNGNTSSFSNELQSLQGPQARLTNAERELALEMARVEHVKAKEMQATRLQLQRRIFTCYSEIDVLKNRLAAAQITAERRQKAAMRSISEVHIPPTDDSRWTTVSFSTQVPDGAWSETSGIPGEVSLWMGGDSRSSASLCTDSTCSSSERLVKVDVSLRVLRVSIDRSRWFQPHFMDKSSDLLRKPGNLPWSKWPTGVNDFEEAVKSIKDGQFDSRASILPAFADSW